MSEKERINREQMFELLLDAEPDFAPVIPERTKQYMGDDFGLLGGFGKMLIQKLERSETTRFNQVFSVVEDLHVRGDDYVQNTITVGLLEELLSKGDDYKKLHPYDFELWLGPETKRCWLAYNKGYFGRTWPQDR